MVSTVSVHTSAVAVMRSWAAAGNYPLQWTAAAKGPSGTIGHLKRQWQPAESEAGGAGWQGRQCVVYLHHTTGYSSLATASSDESQSCDPFLTASEELVRTTKQAQKTRQRSNSEKAYPSQTHGRQTGHGRLGRVVSRLPGLLPVFCHGGPGPVGWS